MLHWKIRTIRIKELSSYKICQVPETEAEAAMKIFFIFYFFGRGKGISTALLREGSSSLLSTYFLIKYHFSMETLENQRANK